jgi:hypothetical protein
MSGEVRATCPTIDPHVGLSRSPGGKTSARERVFAGRGSSQQPSRHPIFVAHLSALSPRNPAPPIRFHHPRPRLLSVRLSSVPSPCPISLIARGFSRRRRLPASLSHIPPISPKWARVPEVPCPFLAPTKIPTALDRRQNGRRVPLGLRLPRERCFDFGVLTSKALRAIDARNGPARCSPGRRCPPLARTLRKCPRGGGGVHKLGRAHGRGAPAPPF